MMMMMMMMTLLSLLSLSSLVVAVSVARGRLSVLLVVVLVGSTWKPGRSS